MKRTRFWVTLIAVLLLVSVLASLLVLRRTAGTVAKIYLDGQCIRSIDLSRVNSASEFIVEGPAGSNTVRVEPGRICVSQADCPDQVCVHQGWISTGAVPVVCLPNRLVIQIEEQRDQVEIDGVSE